MNPKILAFNMNVGNTVLCDQYYNDKTTMEIPSEGIFFKRRACNNPLFFDDIEDAVRSSQPDIVAITTEEMGSGYFHSDFLPLAMQTLNYVELSTYQYNTLNMSIYVKYTNKYHVIGYDTYTYGNNVDSMAIYCQTPYDVIAFVAITQPSRSKMLSSVDANKLLGTILNQYTGYNNVTNAIIMGYIDKKEGDYNIMDIINIGPTQFSIKRNETTAVVYGKYDGLMGLFDIVAAITPKILIFSWNTDKTPLCDKLYNSNLVQKRTRFFQSSPCYSPTFFTQIYNKIKEESPDIVVINTEGDLEKGTFFHAQFLKDHMKHYYLLDNDKINGINTSSDSNSLRMSIYVRHGVSAYMDNVNASLFYKNDRTNSYIIKDGIKITSKSLVKFVNTSFGVFAFMGLEFPHTFARENRQQAFDMMTKTLLKSNKISYVFIMGDFASMGQNEYQTNYNTLASNPNYRLQQINPARQALIYETEEWHDRILYNTMGNTTHDIVCTYYDNVYGFPMLDKKTKSQHLGIMGVYQLDKVTI